MLVLGCLEGLREMRALLVDHNDLHTHRLWNDEDVGEDDGGIDEACVAFDGLEGERGSNFWAAATLEEVVLSLGFMVFGKVATSLAMSVFAM